LSIDLATTASPLEWAWTLLAAVGFVSGIFIMGACFADLFALHRAGVEEGPLDLVARINVRAETLRTLLQGTFLMLGIVAMLRPASPAHDATVSAAIFGVAFIVLELLFIYDSVKTLVQRRQLLRTIGSYPGVGELGLPDRRDREAPWRE
jgi:hypothetical protein